MKSLDCGSSPNHAKAITSLSQDQPLFSQLNQLVVRRWWTAEDAICATALLSQSVKRLTLPWAAGSALVLNDILSRAPLLDRLVILRTDDLISDLEVDWMDFLKKLPALRHLTMPHPSFSNKVVQNLAGLHLQQLVLENETTEDPEEARTGSHIFTKLHTLSVTCQTGHTKDFLHAFTTTELTCFNLEIPTAIPRVFQLVINMLSESSPRMQDLTLTARWNPDLPMRRLDRCDHYTFQSLQPLSACSELKNLHLAFQLPVCLDSAQVHELFSSWPLLSSCHLSPTRSLRPTLHPTLAVLPDIAACCPRLTSLYLSVQAPSTLPDENVGTPFRNLEHLRVYFVDTVANVPDCAMYIAAHVPRSCDAAAGYATRWMQHPCHGNTGNKRSKRTARTMTEMIYAAMVMKERFSK